MNFPRYWARGRSGDFSAWRWSHLSYEDALAAANAAAAQLRARFEENRPAQRYGYADRPLREPVLHEMRDTAGNLSAVVTRNSYGCDVLNAASAMFVDIDLEGPQEANGPGILGSLFSSKPQAPPAAPLASAFARAQAWAYSQPGWNWRVYRTRNGLRLLATHAVFDSKDPYCHAVYDAVGADPLYRRLCDAQQCFRARLTPKPWRCDVNAPPYRWPFLEAAAEQAFLEWQAKYRAATNGHATCQLLPDIGTGFVTQELHAIIALHDNVSRASSGLPLA
jgi:hypothetical protein